MITGPATAKQPVASQPELQNALHVTVAVCKAGHTPYDACNIGVCAKLRFPSAKRAVCIPKHSVMVVALINPDIAKFARPKRLEVKGLYLYKV